MKAKELRELSDEELERKLVDTRQELFNLRFQSVTGALENTARICAREARHRAHHHDSRRAPTALERQ